MVNSAQPSARMRSPVWMDCDTGHDDLLCLLLACFAPDLHLLGVSACHGNAAVLHTTQNAAKTLVAFNAPPHLQVYPGRTGPIIKRAVELASFIHGSDGLGGVKGLPDASDPRVQARIKPELQGSAVDGLRDACLTVLQQGQKLTLLATGSLSNIAAFLLAHSDLAKKALDKLLFMGGTLDEPGNSNPSRTAEWNVYADPEAMEIILAECPCDIVLFPLDVTHKTLFRNQVELLKLQEKSTNQRLIVETTVGFFREAYKREFGFDSPPCHDICTAAFAIQPELFTVREESIVLDRAQGEHRGKISRASGSQVGRTVSVAYDVRLEELWSLFFAALEASEALS